MLLLVHPKFLLVYERKHLDEEREREKKKKAFCYLHYQQRCRNTVCKSDSMQAAA